MASKGNTKEEKMLYEALGKKATGVWATTKKWECCRLPWSAYEYTKKKKRIEALPDCGTHQICLPGNLQMCDY